MVAILGSVAVMCGLLPLVYVGANSLLYIVYKATGGKRTFYSWWKKMEF